MNIEKRTLKGIELNARECNNEEGKKQRTIEGYAVVFGEKSQVLYDWRQKEEFFREIIEPTAITTEDLANYDVRANLYHQGNKLLGRWNGSNTGGLELIVDERGVKFICDLPDCADGKTAYELVTRGIVDGCSFAFTDGSNAGDVTWGKDEDGIPVRHVNRIGGMYDVCITPDPAYQQTSVSARDARECSKTEEEKREDELLEQQAERARNNRDLQLYLQIMR